MLFLDDGSPGTPGGKGGPGQQGGQGSDGISCSFHRTASGSSNDRNCCYECDPMDIHPFNGYKRCRSYQAGKAGSGGPGGPGGPGGDGGPPGWLSVYANSAGEAGGKPISNEEALKILESSSNYGQGGSGGLGGDGGGGGVNKPDALCTTYKKDNFFWVEYKGDKAVKPVGVQGSQGSQGAKGKDSGWTRPTFIRATTNATGHPSDLNKFENPQQWADFDPEPAEYLQFGLELSENMLNSLAFMDDDEAAQNAYSIILQSVSDIMYNAQLWANRANPEDKKVFSSYVNKARTLIKSINRVSTPSGSSLGEVSVKSFESQLDDLDSFRVLAQEVEGYYDEYAKNVNDTKTSEKILAESTKSSLVGVQAQTRLQNELLTALQQMNKTLDEVALNIHLVQMKLGDSEFELDACWEKAQAILKFKTMMEFVSFFTSVADFGFGATKLLGKASDVLSKDEGWFKGIEAASGYKFAYIPGMINNLEKLIPGTGQSANWAPYESSMKLISGDQSSLDGYTGDLQNVLAGIYRAKDYDDAQGVYEKMKKAQDDYKNAKINMAKSEITNKVNGMKSACPGQAQNFFRNFDTLQMWVNQRNDLLAVYTAIKVYFDRVTAKKLYLRNVAQRLLTQLQQNIVNPASIAVATVHQETYNMMVDEFSKKLGLVLNARSYLMMGADKDTLPKLAFANCRWETSILKNSGNMFFKCSADAILQLKNSLSHWHTSVYTEKQLAHWLSYWGPIELNEKTVGAGRWQDFKTTGIINFCMDPTEPIFNRGPGDNSEQFFPLISIDSIYVVLDGAPENSGKRVDIIHQATSGIVRAMENPDYKTGKDSMHPYSTKKFTHADRNLRFIYKGAAPPDEHEKVKSWMHSTNIALKADLGSANTYLRVSPFSNYRVAADISLLEQVDNVRVYFTGYYVPAADFHIAPISSLPDPVFCSSTIGKSTSTTHPSSKNLSVEEAKGLKCSSYSVSAERLDDYVKKDGTRTKACKISIKYPTENQPKLPEKIRVEWEWAEYHDDIDGEHSNGITMAINASKAILSIKHTYGKPPPTETVLLTKTCPSKLRVASTYPDDCQ